MLQQKTLSLSLRASITRHWYVGIQCLTIFIVRLLVRTAFLVRIDGVEQLLAVRGPIILAANHPSRIDAAFLSMLPLHVWISLLPIRFALAEKYYENIGYRVLLVPLGAYRIRRWANSLTEYMEDTVQFLQDGYSVLIFPEGKVVNDRGNAKPGIIHAAIESGSKILPVRIRYLEGSSMRRSIQITIGEIFSVNPNTRSVMDFTEQADRLLKKIYEL